MSIAPPPTPVERLRAAGVRVTAARLAVLAALAEQPHAGAPEIGARVRAVLGTISTQATYDVLAALVEAGLVRRIEPAGRSSLYELRVGDNHHHIVCRQCDAVADVDCAVGETPCLTAADASGYQIDEAEVIYWGRCPACVESASVSSGGQKRTGNVRRQPGDTAMHPA